MTIYQKELKNLLTVCEKYRKKHLGTEELKNSVWQTARTITDTEGEELRNFLQQAEGELDMVQFTCEDVFGESLRIVSEITEKITPMLVKEENSGRDREGVSVELNHGKIRIWIEPDAGFFIRTLAESGDSVRLSGQEARKLADVLVTMADRADKICGTPEPMHA